ncbi:MAG: uracil-DNA glycosylase [Candidatus Eisenbacteria sp.]|nr:uracil-DNA glycosylase [Candidatus Eisenbacteria bacterium]
MSVQDIYATFKAWNNCKKCELAELRENKKKSSKGRAGKIVFPDGNPQADLVIIGIGPGEEEDAQGIPWIGPSGEILNDYLAKVGIDRRTIFTMNIVACRPYSRIYDEVFKKMREENRDPTMTERVACRPMWQELLYLVDPLLVVVMGKPAVLEVTGRRSITMGEANGTIGTCKIPGRAIDVVYPIMMMYHPAFLARSGNTFRGGPWHRAEIAWRRTAYYLDILRNRYRGTPIPDRGYKRSNMFLIQGGVAK